VNDLSLKQPAYSLQTNVRMWRDVHRFGIAERKRPEPIEKTPRADESLLANG
jgi:hypothetical protein